jgi:hypothetical protein
MAATPVGLVIPSAPSKNDAIPLNYAFERVAHDDFNRPAFHLKRRTKEIYSRDGKFVGNLNGHNTISILLEHPDDPGPNPLPSLSDNKKLAQALVNRNATTFFSKLEEKRELNFNTLTPVLNKNILQQNPHVLLTPFTKVYVIRKNKSKFNDCMFGVFGSRGYHEGYTGFMFHLCIGTNAIYQDYPADYFTSAIIQSFEFIQDQEIIDNEIIVYEAPNDIANAYKEIFFSFSPTDLLAINLSKVGLNAYSHTIKPGEIQSYLGKIAGGKRKSKRRRSRRNKRRTARRRRRF